MPESENIRTIAADGRTFVRNSPDGHYDAIFLDAFTIGGRIPFHLVTREFFQLCRQKLAPGGVFVMNINSAVRGKNAEIFESMYTTLGEAFPQVHAFAIGKQLGLQRSIDQRHARGRQQRPTDERRRLARQGG